MFKWCTNSSQLWKLVYGKSSVDRNGTPRMHKNIYFLFCHIKQQIDSNVSTLLFKWQIDSWAIFAYFANINSASLNIGLHGGREDLQILNLPIKKMSLCRKARKFVVALKMIQNDTNAIYQQVWRCQIVCNLNNFYQIFIYF